MNYPAEPLSTPHNINRFPASSYGYYANRKLPKQSSSKTRSAGCASYRQSFITIRLLLVTGPSPPLGGGGEGSYWLGGYDEFLDRKVLRRRAAVTVEGALALVSPTFVYLLVSLIHA